MKQKITERLKKMLKEKIKVKTKRVVDKEKLKGFGICAGYLLAGFLLGMGNILENLSPFALSFVAVSKKRMYIFSGIGAVCGYLIGGITPSSARYLAGCFLVILGTVAGDVFSLYHKNWYPMLVAGLSTLVTGVFLDIKLKVNSSEYLVVIGEALLSIGVAFFYYKSLNANYSRFRLRALPISDLVCIVLSLSTLLINFASLHLGVVYPVRILAIMFILFAIRFESERWGLIFGVSFGFVLGIYDSSVLFLCGALGFASLVAGLFSSMASLGISVSFLCAISFFSIAAGEEVGLALFVDGIIGCGLFLLTPPVICEKIETLLDNGKDLAPDGTLRQNLVLKLRFASSAMAAISDSVEQVREKINQVTRKENEALRDYISEEEYITKEIILEKTNQIRMVASDQFFSISGMLNDLALEFSEAEIFDSNASARIRRLLGEYDIYPVNISAITDKYGRMRVEILTKSSPTELTNPTICKEIGKICDRYFDEGKIINFNVDTMLSFSEKPNYSLKIGFAQHSAEGDLCGDTIKIINDKNGHSILIISDGMGKGSRAALDGAMGAGLLERLVNAGFGFDSALKVVNSALLVKSNDESLATLDIASVDLFTGKCELFKAGAPASYIIKGKSISKCELTSMPAGILRGIEFAKRTAVIGLEDAIVLMSDGITDLGDAWLKHTFSQMPYDSQECADYILNSAIEYMDGEKMDDMSVIFARLERN